MSKPRVATRETIKTFGMSAGEKLLWRFVETERKGGEHGRDDMRALAAAFQQILGGADVKKALGLIRKRGRKELTGAQVSERHERIAFEVYALMKSGMPGDSTRDGAEGAIDRVAKQRG